ncbi:alpha/beta fold hydrolase [Nocardioides sp. Soil796]|uniref:alpha/beta fold hydrolase n=1 Tax=Nocardioides sp. Soil796 TaxID=1736412 RepID=UPI00070C4588|nr:alpha/beta hydrolase [Nocardioides sp. Soil796]KRF15724.1 alpha/beta hydrolase [Nocardioides sp. Soil796]
MAAIAQPESTIDSATPSVYFFDVESADGTLLRAWTNDPDCLIDGPTVVLCNGLGTNPWTTPSLLRPGSGVRVVSWNHRGTGGSARPADRKHVGIEHFVEDAVAVMDHVGLDKAVLLGWSMGVNTMFELAVRHPERVSGLFAYAGVPGATFSTMLAPLHLPKPVARALTVNLARVVAATGKAITPIAKRLPIGQKAVSLVSHSGFMFPVADPELAAKAIREYLTTPIDWYFHLALTTAAHGRVSLSRIDVPTAFVAAKWDLLAGPRDMASAAARIEGATYVELVGSHFIAMEQPERFHELLLEFLDRVR